MEDRGSQGLPGSPLVLLRFGFSASSAWVAAIRPALESSWGTGWPRIRMHCWFRLFLDFIQRRWCCVIDHLSPGAALFISQWPVWQNVGTVLWVTQVAQHSSLQSFHKGELLLIPLSASPQGLCDCLSVLWSVTWRVVAMESHPFITCLCWLFFMSGNLSSWVDKWKKKERKWSVVLTLAFVGGIWHCVSLPKTGKKQDNLLPSSPSSTSAGLFSESEFMGRLCCLVSRGWLCTVSHWESSVTPALFVTQHFPCL